MIIWLIGISGSGKSTIGKLLFDQIKSRHNDWIFIDGDILREVWGDSVGHTIDGRALNAHRISNLCKMLDEQGINVVAAVLSIFPEWQKWNRENFSSYYEVFLDIDLSVAIDRDTKGIYSSALEGKTKNVVGIDIKFPAPPNPDLTIDSSGKAGSAETLAKIIYNQTYDLY